MNRNRCRETLVLLVLSLPLAGCATWTALPERTIEGITHETQPTHSTQPTRGIFKPRRTSNSGVQPASYTAPLDPMAPPNVTGATAPQPMLSDDELQRLDPELAMARLAERQGDRNRARRLYENYVKENASNPLPHHRLGVLASREAKHDLAEQHFRKAITAAPPSTKLLSDVGYFYYLQDRLDEAEQVLQKAHQQEPSDKTVCNNLALVYGARGDFREALAYFRKVNDEAKARANLAYVLSQHGKLDAARGEYLAALTMDNKLRRAAKGLLQVDDARKLDQKMAAAETPQSQHPNDIIKRDPTNAPKHLERTLRDYTIGNRPSPQPQPARASRERASREPELADARHQAGQRQPQAGQRQPQFSENTNREAADASYANALSRPEQPVGLFPSLYNRSRPTRPMLEPHAHRQELSGMAKDTAAEHAALPKDESLAEAKAATDQPVTLKETPTATLKETPTALKETSSDPSIATAKATTEKPVAPPLLNPAAPAAHAAADAPKLQPPRFATNEVKPQGTAAKDGPGSDEQVAAIDLPKQPGSTSVSESPAAERFLASATPSFLKGFFTKPERDEPVANDPSQDEPQQSPADLPDAKSVTSHTIVARRKPLAHLSARPKTDTPKAHPPGLLQDELHITEPAQARRQPVAQTDAGSMDWSGEVKELDEESVSYRPSTHSFQGRRFTPATPATAPQASRTSRWSDGPAEDMPRQSVPRPLRPAPTQPVRLSLSDTGEEAVPADNQRDRSVQPASHFGELPPRRNVDRDAAHQQRPAGTIRLRRSAWSEADDSAESQLRVIRDGENEDSQPKRFRLSDR